MNKRRLAMLAILLALAPGCPSPPAARPDAGAALPDAASTVPPDASRPDEPGDDAGAPDAGKPVLAIKSVLPSRGPVAGGTQVTLEGGAFYQGFADGASAAKKSTRIHFGGNEVAQFDIIDDGTLELVAPPNPAGAVDVTLENPNGKIVCPGCFTYFIDLQLDAVAPASGRLEGGTLLSLTGSAFSPGVTVIIGGKVSPTVSLVDDGHAQAVTPPGDAPGPVDVEVFNKSGIGLIRRGFTYVERARIDRVEPPYGELAGGNAARVVGASLSAATRVHFGPSVATFLALSDGSLEATVPPALVAGPVDVIVETPAGSATRPAGYVYFDAAEAKLTIYGVWPTHGPASGGNAVSVVGAGFDVTTTFTIGGVSAPVVGTPTPNVVTVTVPAGPANSWVGVVATKPGSASLDPGYHYNLALDSVSPASGASHGGEAVVLSGAGFVDGLEVSFGALAATGVSATSPTALAATTPPGAGKVDVRVKAPADFENESVLANGYRFIEPLSIGRVSPELGSISGGTYVTILGTGFSPGVSVLFGTTPLKDLQVVDSHSIIGHTPPAPAGAVDVTAKLAAQSDVSPSAFTYYDPTSGGGGSTGGPLDGTLNVTVLESSYLHYGQPLPGATVMLGADPTTPFQGKTDRHGQITFSDPQLVKAQTVTAFKDGYEPITVAGQESQNLTLYLSATVNTPNPPQVPQPSAGGGPAIISGHVNGFKLPRTLNFGESVRADVWVVPSSAYSTAPFGAQASADARTSRGERWRITTDGGTFSIFSGSGLHAIYAVFGIYNRQTDTFTPALMGVRRGINADENKPQVNQDIVLDMHLDQSVPVHLDEPAGSLVFRGMAVATVYAWLELGAEGVIPLGSVTNEKPDLVLTSMPHVDGDNLLFLARSVDLGTGPDAYVFSKQLGDLTAGVTVGPMLGLLSIDEPAPGELFAGRLSWTLHNTTEADVAQLSLGRISPATGWTTIWSAIIPGTDRSIALPQNLFDDLIATSQQGDQVVVQLACSRAARFDYAHWSYDSLGRGSWNSWANASATFDLFPPPIPLPPKH